MEALFFGPSSSSLLGVYHPASAHQDRYQGVVLCYPFGQEYMRAHRAFRQLAVALAKKGFHVLRFDYPGTGDSAGNIEEVTARQWSEGIEIAVQELKDMAGVQSVTLVGLRLGALLAADVAARRNDITGLVLWDPIITGGGYVDALKVTSAHVPSRRRQSNFIDADGNLHFNGFAMSIAFQASLADLNLVELRPACGRILQVSSHESDGFSALRQMWQCMEGYEYRHVPAAHDWNYVDHVGGILLPQPILQEIIHWM
ncbi:MAG: alpha/beta fold hydrolase [Cellvibrionaceae bacterium]